MDEKECNHTRSDFEMSYIGRMYVYGGNLHENFRECYMCRKCGKVYIEKEFEVVPYDKPATGT